MQPCFSKPKCHHRISHAIWTDFCMLSHHIMAYISGFRGSVTWSRIQWRTSYIHNPNLSFLHFLERFLFRYETLLQIYEEKLTSELCAYIFGLNIVYFQRKWIRQG